MKIVSDFSFGARPHRPRTGLPQPALRLDFMTGTYQPGGFGAGLTFTRAGAAQYHDAAGVMQVAAADQPRLDHERATGTPRGLLMEGARSNVFLQSAAPATQSIPVTAQAYALSFWGSGSIALTGAHVATLTGSGGATRVTLLFTPAAGGLTLTVSGDVQMAQLEAGDCATSYIATTATPVARAADSLQVTLGGWWPGPLQGSLLAEFTCPAVPQLAIVATFNTATSNNSILLFKSNATSSGNGIGTYVLGALKDTVAVFSAAGDVGLAAGPHKAAMVWDAESLRAAANGLLGPSVGPRAPNPTKLWLGGRDGGQLPLNGHLRRVAYYTQRLSDAQVQALTL